jgi:zinc transporter ZupT
MGNTLWQVIAAYGFAVAGGWISTSLRLKHKPLCALISFAAGTLLGVTIFAIFPESSADCPWWAVLLALASGYALFFFISKHVHHVCPACAASHFDADATRYFSEIATALIVALAIHSTTDGLALGMQGETPATDVTKWSLFSALCVHKVPEGLALGSLLIGAGFTRVSALGWVAAVEATTLVGGVIGYFFLTGISTLWLGLIMAYVGGGFFYLAVHAVLGEMLKHGKKLVLTSFSLGIVLIAILNMALRMVG